MQALPKFVLTGVNLKAMARLIIVRVNRLAVSTAMSLQWGQVKPRLRHSSVV
jgi:hypothetical protein